MFRYRCWHFPKCNNKCMCVARSWNLNGRRHSSMSLQVGHSVVLVLSKFILRLLLNSTVELHMMDNFFLTASARCKVPIDLKAQIFSTSSLRAIQIDSTLPNLLSQILSLSFSCVLIEMFFIQMMASFMSLLMC